MKNSLFLATLVALNVAPPLWAAEIVIEIKNNGLGDAQYVQSGVSSQLNVVVNVGDTVKWVNTKSNAHTATSDLRVAGGDGALRPLFDTQQIAGGSSPPSSKSHTFSADDFTKAATALGAAADADVVHLGYFCGNHPSKMGGKLVLVRNTEARKRLADGMEKHAERAESVLPSRRETAKIYSVESLKVTIIETKPPQALLRAVGTVTSTGWSDGTLVPYVYVKPPADGIYDFDFVAKRPSGVSLPVLTPITAATIYPNLTGVRGFRVHTVTNNKEVLIDATAVTAARVKRAVDTRDGARSTPAPDLPLAAKQMMAEEQTRMHHHLWHLVRNQDAWNDLSPADRQQLTALGWNAPRFETAAGAGLDFLYMHRVMIGRMNTKLAEIGDPYWDKVKGWAPIPWAADDPEWPVPEWTNPEEPAAWARDPVTVQQMREADGIFRDPDQLRQMSLDQLGQQIEFSIHGWMHLRWSGPPPADPLSTDPSNDWLYIPYSSHVNKHFWKLHGWIDDRIGDWETATGQKADFASGWAGPGGPGDRHEMPKNVRAMDFVPSVRVKPLPMLPRAEVFERLLRGR